MKDFIKIAQALLIVTALVYPQAAPAYIQGYTNLYERTEDKRVSRPRKDPVGSNADIGVHIEADTESLTIGCNDTITYAIYIENSGVREKTNVYANLGRDTYLIKASHGPRTSSREIQWEDLYTTKEDTTIVYVTVGLRPSFRFSETEFKVVVEGNEDIEITKVKNDSVVCKKNLQSGDTVYLADARADILFPTDNNPGSIQTSLTADRSETQPGSSIIYTYTIQNTTEISLKDIAIEFSIPRELGSITETSAGIKNENIVTIQVPRLLGSEQYTGTVRVQAERRLQHGQTIPATLHITDAFGKKKITSEKIVSILENFPQTGTFVPSKNSHDFTRVTRANSLKSYLLHYIVLFGLIITISATLYYSKKH